MSTFSLAVRMLWRDLRAGSLTLLALAQILAVAALTGVGFLAERVQKAVEMEAHQLLGGDLLLTADHRWDSAFRTAAESRGLRVAESASFPSMVASANGVQLAEIKAVSPEFPLRGSLRIAPALNQVDAPASAMPASGTVWPDERLATALKLGRDDVLQLGASQMRVAAVLTFESDRGINPFAVAPRLMLPFADLEATQLIQPTSRVNWRLHLAGESTAVADYRRWADERLGRGERIEGLDNARPEIRNVVDRAQRFLRLAALLTVVLAAVAVGLSARRYMQTHLDGCAVMRCIGARGRQILLIHGGEFVLLGLGATLLGGLLGHGLQAALLGLLDGIVGSDLPPAGGTTWIHGLAVGLVLTLGFVLPPLLRLQAVPTVRVLRREWGEVEPLSVFSYLIGLASLAGLMFWMAESPRLGAVVLGGFLVAIAAFALGARLLLRACGHLPAGRLGGGWRIALANLRRRGDAVMVQAVALAIGLTTLLLLTLARDDLLAAWQTKVPPDAPNRFVINIQPEQRAAIVDFLSLRGLPVPQFEPMIRGRLTRVNGRPVSSRDFSDERAQRLVEREFNLSARDTLPPGNEIVAGHWHAPGALLQYSVEKGLAETLNLHVGDELQFVIAGQPVAGRITSLRRLEWDSMRVNFFVVAPGGSLDNQPTSYITSFYLPAGKEPVVEALVRHFPNLTVIDVASLLRQLQATIDQVARAVQLVFGFALLAGVVVLVAALQASAAERRHELALLRALGARKRQIYTALLGEFAALGAIAGLMAGGAASLLAFALAQWVFHLDYWPSLVPVLAGLLFGLLAVVGVGLSVSWRGVSGTVLGRLRDG